MRWKSRFMAAFSHVAVPNITAYWIAFQAMCLMMIWMRPELAERLMFNTEKVMAGEWWRALLFVFMPGNLSPIFAAFALYFLWMMGTALEMNWGTARFNLYLWAGWGLNLAAAFLPVLTGQPGGVGSNHYLLESVFLAFAVLYPDFVIRLFFILPVKVKWLALVTWILLFIQFVFADWTGKAMVVASVGNFLLFFWQEILERMKFGKRQMGRQMKRITTSGPAAPAFIHRCVVCSATDRSSPQLEFRYCTACGGACYCLTHLREHVCTAARV